MVLICTDLARQHLDAVYMHVAVISASQCFVAEYGQTCYLNPLVTVQLAMNLTRLCAKLTLILSAHG